MTKFYVGDEARIVRKVSEDCALSARVGDIVRIVGKYDGRTYPIEYGGGIYGFITPGSIEAARAKGPATDRRLTEAEAKIATLEAEVKALKDTSVTTNITVNADSQTFDSYAFARKMADALGVSRKPSPTPNQRRADVIKRAQAFVKAQFTKMDGEYVEGRHGHAKVDFYVNAEKRTVVARLSNAYCGDWSVKAIAKCAPDDVFNADIGKAIALGRALGLDVSEFENAVKPTEVVVGMRVKYVGAVSDRFGDIDTVCPPGQYPNRGGKCAIDSGFARGSVITDDTDAVYE